MTRRILAVLLAALVAVPAAAAFDRKQAQALLRVAVKASGLKARTQVKIVVERPAPFAGRRVRMLDRAYPRAAQEYDETVYRALGLVSGGKGVLRKALIETENSTGLYDPGTRTAYVRRGSGENASALHEIVHALQDQHYDLRRAYKLPGGSDAMAAAMAAIEGHAALVADVLVPRRTSSHGGAKLTRFVQLQRGFAYEVGLRFAAELRNLGGNAAVLGSLRRFPETTEQVFHLDKYLERERAVPIVLPVDAAGSTLWKASTFGELDVRALLAVFGVPRLDHAGAGWGGGRTAVYRHPGGDSVAVALDWDTERDALEWLEAVIIYVNEAFDAATPGLPPVTPCAATICWQVGGRAIAFERDGERTALTLGNDLDRAAGVALAILGR
ncbi:MAG TPA: hypothetical protein VM184_03070 [Gaiellaceae bacterium]|nr:hypothetical protein [Gaiellaceae bacterium]